MKIILPYLSNEPSRAEFQHREGIQKWPTNSSMHFYSRIHHFLPVLGKSIFEPKNVHQMKQIKNIWKLYFHSFPTSHLGPNYDIRKASKSGLQTALCISAQGFTSFDQCWENKFLKDQMDTKWKNSSFSGNNTSTSFQLAISRPMPTPGRHSKMVYKQLDAFLHQDLPVLTSVGKINFGRIKWRPNDKIQVVLESRLPRLSNEPSRAQFWHREGLQNELQTCATCLEKGATCLERKIQRAITKARRACSSLRHSCRKGQKFA